MYSTASQAEAAQVAAEVGTVMTRTSIRSAAILAAARARPPPTPITASAPEALALAEISSTRLLGGSGGTVSKIS